MRGDRRDAGSDFDRLARSNVVDQAYGALLEAILLGRISPGAPLREARVAEQMGVSRAPVREACRLLEVQGLVRSEPNRGFFVRDFTETDITDIYEARAVLEAAALRKAARSISETELSGLTTLCDALEAATKTGELDELPVRVVALHRGIVALAGNTVLLRVFEALSHDIIVLMRWVGLIYVNGPEVVARNRRLIATIATRDRDRAAEEVAAYIEETRARTLRQFAELQRSRGNVIKAARP
jgi:DNA-binding GntR family transcriptional regulator